MALETGTYISDLVATNPTSGDPVSQADDHLRLIKSTVKATFPNVAGAVTPTHTELNYVSGVTSAIQTQLTQAKLTAAVAQSMSGTSVDFTSIPSWVKRITVIFSSVSTSGGSNVMVQIGGSGGIETSSYVGAATQLANAAPIVSTVFTTGFGVSGAIAASSVIHGRLTLTLIDGSTRWISSGVVSFSDAQCHISGGNKVVSTTLDRLRITTVNGTDTFDAGQVNIQYE